MDIVQLIRVNLPMVILNVLTNLFFIFCLMRPFQGETLKQPLKLLLWTVICSTLSFLVSLLLLFHLVTDSIVASISIYGMFVFSLSVSMGTSVWLNFFYYMQIVPSKSTVFVWMKRNLKSIIYCIWVFEKLIHGLTVISILIFNISIINYVVDFNSNSTNTSSVIFISSHLVNLRFSVIATQIYFIICMCFMSACSWSTATYLSRHMRQMASQGLSCSRFRSQVRVTVTGILQGTLYVLISVCVLSQYMLGDFLVSLTPYLTFYNVTTFNVYMMGTSVNLGVGQTVFRQRSVDLWHRAVQWCKTMRAQQPQPGGS